MVKRMKPPSSPTKRKRIGRGRPPKERQVMQGTGMPEWERIRYVERIARWRNRLAPYAKKLNEAQCGSCQMSGRCHRIPANYEITDIILSGKPCPDYRSMWKQICGKDEEPYDWGF